MSAELVIRFNPETIEMLEQDVLSEEAATRLGKAARMILDYEANKLDMRSNTPEKVRQWLINSKLRIDREFGRYGIAVVIEARTMYRDTKFNLKFNKCEPFNPAQPGNSSQ